MAGLSRKHIIEICEEFAAPARIDYIDLYHMHRWDFTTPIEETLEALDYLVRAGKVRYLGASSMAAWQFSKASTPRASTDGIASSRCRTIYNLLIARKNAR